MEINNILVIGITGNGKSALANLLTNTDEFRDGKKVKYRIIDNIGFGDTNKISEEEILLKIGEGIYSAKEGINQVLFVFAGRFGPEQVVAFDTFKKFISESGITKFTTLVRTNFPNFKDEKACEKDRQDLLKEENKDLRETINSCNGIIYVDNPPIPEIDEEEMDSDDEREKSEIMEKKQASREKVLNHLAENCRQEPYKLKK
ncbi:5242_t:CDS:2 [Cetraspora pellucida]|uniref:5242_t:CDS:1 n=1 Tax=Cetraspora pellucida TaxID=1433469 RepID=A0ACA9MBY2_9GLOM|nr:5242_t:CDS:2 [Cetraspora pellucida]